MSNFESKLKAPNAHLDFGFDWADPSDPWLAPNETISGSVWGITGAPDDALALGSSSNTQTSTTVWIDGGTAGVDYTVRNTVTTSAGRVDSRSMTIKVRAR